MSLHYLIDGYNVLKKAPSLAGKKLQDGRSELIRLIRVHRPHGSVNNKITVVFDGQLGFWQDERPDDVEVIFSTTGSADEKIKDIVERKVNKKDVVVVTDDKALKLYVRAQGTSILSVQEFHARFKTLDLRSSSGGHRTPGQTQGINDKVTYTQAHAINKEFEEIWVKKNKGSNKN